MSRSDAPPEARRGKKCLLVEQWAGRPAPLLAENMAWIIFTPRIGVVADQCLVFALLLALLDILSISAILTKPGKLV